MKLTSFASEISVSTLSSEFSDRQTYWVLILVAEEVSPEGDSCTNCSLENLFISLVWSSSHEKCCSVKQLHTDKAKSQYVQILLDTVNLFIWTHVQVWHLHQVPNEAHTVLIYGHISHISDALAVQNVCCPWFHGCFDHI